MCTFNLSTEQARDMYLAELEEKYPNVAASRLRVMVPEYPEGSPEYVVYASRVRRAIKQADVALRLAEDNEWPRVKGPTAMDLKQTGHL